MPPWSPGLLHVFAETISWGTVWSHALLTVAMQVTGDRPEPCFPICFSLGPHAASDEIGSVEQVVLRNAVGQQSSNIASGGPPMRTCVRHKRRRSFMLVFKKLVGKMSEHFPWSCREMEYVWRGRKRIARRVPLGGHAMPIHTQASSLLAADLGLTVGCLGRQPSRVLVPCSSTRVGPKVLRAPLAPHHCLGGGRFGSLRKGVIGGICP